MAVLQSQILLVLKNTLHKSMYNKCTHIHKAPLPRGLHANALGRRWVGMVRLRLEGGSLSLDLLPMDVAEAA